MATRKINGQVFDWTSIKISAPWGIDVEIQDINYKTGRPVTMAQGRGNAPRGYGRGNLEQDGSITLNAQAYRALSLYAATQGGLFNIKPFVITVSYANDDQIPMIDVLDGVMFTEATTEAAQGAEEVGMRSLNLAIANPIKLDGVSVM